MTSPDPKPWKSTALLGMSALLFGALAVTFLMAAFLPNNGAPEIVSAVFSRPAPFPENEAALDKMSQELARKGAALAGIEPAAGDAKKK